MRFELSFLYVHYITKSICSPTLTHNFYSDAGHRHIYYFILFFIATFFLQIGLNFFQFLDLPFQIYLCSKSESLPLFGFPTHPPLRQDHPRGALWECGVST